MSTPMSLHALAYYAREHFGEDGYPFEECIPSSFDLVLQMFVEKADTDDSEVTVDLSRAMVFDRLYSRTGFTPVAEHTVDEFVRLALNYIGSQFDSVDDARRNQLTLSHLFWGNLVESRAMFGPLRVAGCSCGYMMHGRSDEDLYCLVRRHLAGQTEPQLHHHIALPETVTRRRPLTDDLLVETFPSDVATPAELARL